MSQGDDTMFTICNRYVDDERRLQSLHKRIGELHEQADALLGSHEADGRKIKTAMTVAGTPVVQVTTGGPCLVLQGPILKVVELARAIKLELPQITPGLPSHDEALEDAKLALDNAIEDCNDAAEAAAYCKVRAVPAEAVSA